MEYLSNNVIPKKLYQLECRGLIHKKGKYVRLQLTPAASVLQVGVCPMLSSFFYSVSYGAATTSRSLQTESEGLGKEIAQGFSEMYTHTHLCTDSACANMTT